MQKIWNKYRKIILGVLAAVFFTLLVFFSYDKLKFFFKKKDNVSDLETVADVQQNVLKFHPLTYTAAWYSDTAEQLWSVMKDYIYITKCPWEKIEFAFTKLKHYADFLELKKAFGLRSYGIGLLSSNYSLPNYIQAACSKECQVFYGAYVTGWEQKFKKLSNGR